MKERKVSINNIPNMYKYRSWFQNYRHILYLSVLWNGEHEWKSTWWIWCTWGVYFLGVKLHLVVFSVL